MHGNATQIQKHCVDFHREWLTTWNGASKLIATPPTKLLGLAGSGAVIDEPITLALGTYLHRYTPSRRWAYLSRGGKYNRGQDIDVTTWLTLSYRVPKLPCVRPKRTLQTLVGRRQNPYRSKPLRNKDKPLQSRPCWKYAVWQCVM